MGMPEEDYVWLIVESYRPSSTAGKHGPIHVRPAPGQGYDQSLQVRCPREMVRNFPEGTRFKLRVKLTNRDGGGEFLSAPHQWPFYLLD
jgi:hypothetical protein